MYVRCKDPETGHEIDRPEGDPLITAGLLKIITSKRWPPVRHPRRPKFHIPKTPARQPDQSASSPEAPDATEKE